LLVILQKLNVLSLAPELLKFLHINGVKLKMLSAMAEIIGLLIAR